MRVLMFWLMAVLSCSGFAHSGLAQAAAPNPIIKARGVNDDTGDMADLPAHTLKFEKLDVHVNIVGGFAQTRMEVIVANSTDEDELEGDFRLAMPDGSIVNGYALNVDEDLIEGVIIAKERGEKAYTDKVTEKIDPGLAEIIGANTYRTRVYPINSEESRSFAVEFMTPLVSGHYELPFSSTGKIGEMTITIEGDSRSVERATLPSGNWIRTTSGKGESKNKYAVRAKNVHPNGLLRIPASKVKPTISQHTNGQKFVSFMLERSELSRTAPALDTKLRIYWDTSYSRDGDKYDDELRLIRNLTKHRFSNNPNYTVELIIGNSNVNAPISFSEKHVLDIDKYVEHLTYEGASNLQALLSSKTSQADLCLIFTDGHATLSGSYLPKLDCRVFTLSADKNANSAYLNLLASKNGGRFIGADDMGRFVDSIVKTPVQSQLVGGNLDKMRLFDVDGKTMLIAPISGVVPTFVEPVLMGGTHARTLQRRISDIPVVKHNGAATLWARRIAEEIRAEGEAGYLPLITHAQKYNLPGPETSLIVLESPEDYVEADIEPPVSYPLEYMAEFIEAQAEKRVEKLEGKSERLEEVVEIWEAQKVWWAKDFAKLAKPEQKKMTHSAGVPAPMPAPVFRTNTDGYVVQQDVASEEADSEAITDEVIATGTNIGPPKTKITTKAWSPDRPYIVALKAVPDVELDATYLAQRKVYGQSPGFFLDVGDFYHQRGDDERAAQVVLSALELEIAGSQTRTAVANRLLDYGYTEQAVYLLRMVTLREDFRPQPFYDLAMALTAHGDGLSNKDARNTAYVDALQNFDTVIRTAWSGDYDGIELVALMDANALIHKLPRKLKHRIPLDARLIENLDVDVRVIIDWNFDRADIDLWVVEPTTEKASYQNHETRSGGQLSNDMTNGYGPEQYLIHNAPKGLYKVIANYYGSNAYNPNGAIAVRARLFKDFGRKNQTMQSITIEFVKENRSGAEDDDVQDDGDIDNGHGEYPLAEIEVK